MKNISKVATIVLVSCGFNLAHAGNQDPLLMYTTSKVFYGNLNGIKGADNKCQEDKSCPSGKVCKAVIGDGDNRRVCVAHDKCGSDYSRDWVLYPNQVYIGLDGHKIGTTNDDAIFKPRSTTMDELARYGSWSGFDFEWVGMGSSNTCYRWEHGNNNVQPLNHILYSGAIYGRVVSCYRYTSNGAFNGKSCDIGACKARTLLCAEMR